MAPGMEKLCWIKWSGGVWGDWDVSKYIKYIPYLLIYVSTHQPFTRIKSHTCMEPVVTSMSLMVSGSKPGAVMMAV